MNESGEFHQACLDARHAEFNTPEKQVFEMVRRATGQTPVARRKIVKGSIKEVYFVAAEGREFVVVINRSGGARLDEEVWCLETLRRANVPVPQVLLFDCLEDEEKPLQFIVQTKVLGQPLEDVRGRLTPVQKQTALRNMGEVLAQIHAVRTEGFYKRHADGAWDFRRWSRMMEVAARDRAAERKWILQAGFNQAEFDSMMRFVQRYGKEFDCAAPVLCHGDYTTDHVYVDDDLRVCGVIDFGDCQGNHPVHDFAVLRLWEDEQLEKTMRQGYGRAKLFDDCFELRLNLHLLMLQIGYLAYHIGIPNHPETPLYVRGVRTTLKWLQKNS